MGWRQRSRRSQGSNSNGTARCMRRCSRNTHRPWQPWSLQQSASSANSTQHAFAAALALSAHWCFTTPLDPPRSAGMPSGRAACASGNVVTERVNHRHDSLHRTEQIEGVRMIARVWHGRTKPEHADAYESHLKPELLPGLTQQTGFRGSYLLRRAIGNEVEFITIILWNSLDDVRAIAGEDYEDAVIPDDRIPLLTRYDARAAHYEVV